MLTHDLKNKGTIAGLAAWSFIVLMALPMPTAMGQSQDEQSTRKAFSDGTKAYESGDYATAMRILRPLAEQNIPGAQTYMGRMHELGHGVPKDGVKASQWYLRAANNGGATAALDLAVMYQTGDGIERNVQAAIRWFKFSAANGNRDAPNHLGVLYSDGKSVPRDLLESFAWFSVAVDMGNKTGLENLKEVASKLSSEQVQTGRQRIKALRARLPEWRSVPTPSTTQAAPEPSKVQRFDASLAERGRQAYLAGDYEAAMSILLPQAEGGHTHSQFFVARMLEKGRGTQRNDREAVKWYTLAAQGGHPVSLDNLGLMYMSGRGVAKDPAAAAELFYLAATMDNWDGQLNYGYCCATGQGRPKNVVEGRAWYQLAADQGDKVALRNIQLCEREMTDQQREQALRRAAELKSLVHTGKFDRKSMPAVPIAPFLRGSQPTASVSRSSTPSQKLERFASPDGKLVLFRPPSWQVEVGAIFGEGTYGVTVDNPADTAGIVFVTIPAGGARFRDSTELAIFFLDAFGGELDNFEVRKMTSAPNRQRTRAMVHYVEEGVPSRAVAHFFQSPQASTMIAFGAEDTEWERAMPQLLQVVSNLAYSPSGVEPARRAGLDDKGAAGAPIRLDRGIPSPLALLETARKQPVRTALRAQSLPDGTATVEVPEGWVLVGSQSAFMVASERSNSPRFAVAGNVRQITIPGVGYEDNLRQAGHLVAHPMSPARALAMLVEHDRTGSNVRILSVNGAEDLDAAGQRELQQIARMSASRVDSQVFLFDFVSPQGERRRGISQITTSVRSLGATWQCLVRGAWAPAGEFDKALPLLFKVLASHRSNDALVSQNSQNELMRMRSNFAASQRAHATVERGNDDYNRAWEQEQKSKDYQRYMYGQTSLGQSSWVAEREGGEVIHTDSSGATDETGRRLEAEPWNTTNFDGRSPWTGDDLQEVNTYELWDRHVRGK